MSNSSRTKLIIFAPYLSIVNELDHSLYIAQVKSSKNLPKDLKELPAKKGEESAKVNRRLTIYYCMNKSNCKSFCFFLIIL